MNTTLIHVPDVFFANSIFFLVLCIFFVFAFRRTTEKTTLLTLDDTNELKGLAMISIICIHIGYSLVDNTAYLSPLSQFAGVGVDIFLFLSGYGLTMSMLKKKLGIIDFYKQRLIRLAIPFWCVLIGLLVMDLFILGRQYSWQYVLQSFAFYFPTARIMEDINSPFWYMSWLVFFYILFPIFFSEKRIWITTLLLATVAYLFSRYNPLDMESNWLHDLHVFAFPLGVWIASFSYRDSAFLQRCIGWRKQYSTRWTSIFLYIMTILFITGLYQVVSWKLVGMSPLLSSFRESVPIVEQIRSLAIMFFIILIVIWKPFKNQFLMIFGVYSFELYLIHWPLISRYDFIFQGLPVWIATILSFAYLLFLSMILQRFFRKIS